MLHSVLYQLGFVLALFGVWLSLHFLNLESVLDLSCLCTWSTHALYSLYSREYVSVLTPRVVSNSQCYRSESEFSATSYTHTMEGDALLWQAEI
jgi:hypothetical protein